MAYSLTYQNDCLFQVNFKTGTVYKESRYGMKSYPCGNTIDEDLGDLQVCKVPIRSIQDIYKTLTNRELLDKLLHQHIPESYPVEFKDMILDYFTDIKDRILIGDLHNLQGRNLEEERKVKNYLLNDKIQFPKCQICEVGNGNIHCINCDVWMCADHWRQHRKDFH